MTIEQVQNELLTKEVFRNIRVKAKDISIIDMEHVKIGGNNIIQLEKRMFTKLLVACGLKKTLLAGLFEAYKDQREILKIIMERFKARSKDQNIILVYNVVSNKLVNITVEGNIITSHASYLDLLERQLTAGNELRDLNIDYNTGSVKATLYNQHDFDILGLKDEFFKSGFSFDYDLTKLSASYFTQRLVCANGMMSTQKFGELEVTKPSEIGIFINETRDKHWANNNIRSIVDQSVQAMNTRASVNEVMNAYKTIKNTITPDKFAMVSNQLTGSRILKELPQSYFVSDAQHKYLNSPITKYDVMNEITAVSSYFENHKDVSLDTYANRGLQKAGGDILFKPSDLPTGKLVQFYN